jgi:hypothetical protein
MHFKDDQISITLSRQEWLMLLQVLFQLQAPRAFERVSDQQLRTIYHKIEAPFIPPGAREPLDLELRNKENSGPGEATAESKGEELFDLLHRGKHTRKTQPRKRNAP